MKKIFFLLLCLIHTPLFAESLEERGLSIAKQADLANNGFQGEQNEMEMILVNAHGDKITRKLSSKITETSSDGDQSVITFHWPADVKGTKMLTWTHKTTSDDQWLFLPSLNRVKRISSSNKSGSFMGSEFSYEDLGSQEIEKYTYKWLRDEKMDPRDVQVIERVPTDVKSGYSRQLVWMDREYFNPLRIEYYDRKNELLKTALFKNYKKLDRWWRVETIHMENHQTKKQSFLVWQTRKLSQKFAPADFQSTNLGD